MRKVRLLLLMIMLFSCLPINFFGTKGQAEATRSILVEEDFLKVSYAQRPSESGTVVDLYLECTSPKKGNEQRLKLQVTDTNSQEQLAYPELDSFTQKDDWFVENHFSLSMKEKMTFHVPADAKKIKLKLQMDERVSGKPRSNEEEIHKDSLAKELAGPHEIKLDSRHTQATSSTLEENKVEEVIGESAKANTEEEQVQSSESIGPEDKKVSETSSEQKNQASQDSKEVKASEKSEESKKTKASEKSQTSSNQKVQQSSDATAKQSTESIAEPEKSASDSTKPAEKSKTKSSTGTVSSSNKGVHGPPNPIAKSNLSKGLGFTTNWERSHLLISPYVFNDPEQMEVTTPSGKTTPTVHKVHEGASLVNYKSLEDHKHKIYYLYSGKVGNTGKGKIYLDYGTQNVSDTEVTVKYPKVGFLVNDQAELVPVGAKVTIDNMVRQPYSSSGTGSLGSGDSNYNNLKVGIDLSVNLFSGTVLHGLTASDWHFEFYKLDAAGNFAEQIDFSEGEKSVLSFTSLNGYRTMVNYGTLDPDHTPITRGIPVESRPDGATNNYEGTFPEFVRPHQNVLGIKMEDSHIGLGKVKSVWPQGYLQTGAAIPDGSAVVHPDVYHGTRNLFTDWLGSEDFYKNAVSFPLKGIKNGYTMGTSGLYEFRQWNTFSSARTYPVRHRSPAKTVQPIYINQNEEAWNDGGTESGWAQRYWNDLDRYYDGHSSWDLKTGYRVEDHDADNPAKLAPGVKEKEHRFVSHGQEHYYFINQETVDLAAESIITPTGYVIEDQLPLGVELANPAEPDSNFTLYDLKGEEIAKPFENFDETTAGGFKLKFNEETRNTINEQIKDLTTEEVEEGARHEFSLRVRVKVTNDAANDAYPDLMENQAKTTFEYPEEFKVPGNGLSAYSNFVHTRLKDSGMRVLGMKSDEFGESQDVEFDLYQADAAGKPTGTKLATIESENGIFKVNDLGPGKYVLVETVVPEGYQKKQFGFTVSDSFEVKWDGNYDQVYVLLDSARQPIGNKTFMLFEMSPSGEPVGDSLEEVTTSSRGGFRLQKTYEMGQYLLVEKGADTPQRYRLDIDADGQISNMNNAIRLVNELDAGNIKVDEETKVGLAGVEFDAYLADDNGVKQGEKLNTQPIVTDATGHFKLPDALSTGTYLLEETKTASGYTKRNFLFKVDANGKVTQVAKDGFSTFRLVHLILKDDGTPLLEQTLKIQKDEAGQPGEEVATVQTDARGWVNFPTDLAKGDYHLVNEDAAYRQKFKVTEPNVIVGIPTMRVFDNNKGSLKIKLLKKDQDTNDPISQVQFKIYEKNGDDEIPARDQAGNEIDPSEKSTDQDGNVSFENLALDKVYYLKETQPAENYQANPHEYKVYYDEQQSKWCVFEDDRELTNSTAVSSEGVLEVSFTVTNKKKALELELEKVDATDPTIKLKDVVFTLQELPSGQVVTKTTNEQGLIRFTGLAPGKIYELKETKTQLNYVNHFQSIQLQIVAANDGNYSVQWRKTANDNWQELSAVSEGADFYGKVNNTTLEIALTIKNPPQGILPKTGGEGIYRLLIMALSLAIIGIIVGVVMYLRNRKEGSR